MRINMMHMVAIMVACYFLTLTLLCTYRNIINTRIANSIFIVIDVIFFFCWNLAAYHAGWLKSGFMTFGNISPFIMTLIPLTVFMSKKVRSYCNSAIAFLWIGMFIALMISPEHAYIFNYSIDASFLYSSEAACHLLASLYGIWLIISGQVSCDWKSWIKSIVCMYSVIGFGVFLNFVFHTNNFGMTPYGKYSIYMINIFGSYWATLIAYILGVLLVLTIGMQAGMLLSKLVSSTGIDFYKKTDERISVFAKFKRKIALEGEDASNNYEDALKENSSAKEKE